MWVSRPFCRPPASPCNGVTSPRVLLPKFNGFIWGGYLRLASHLWLHQAMSVPGGQVHSYIFMFSFLLFSFHSFTKFLRNYYFVFCFPCIWSFWLSIELQWGESKLKVWFEDSLFPLARETQVNMKSISQYNDLRIPRQSGNPTSAVEWLFCSGLTSRYVSYSDWHARYSNVCSFLRFRCEPTGDAAFRCGPAGLRTREGLKSSFISLVTKEVSKHVPTEHFSETSIFAGRPWTANFANFLDF